MATATVAPKRDFYDDFVARELRHDFIGEWGYRDTLKGIVTCLRNDAADARKDDDEDGAKAYEMLATRIEAANEAFDL